jgi:curli biogenesis system outer membrane secretion channel CsgG
VNKLSSHLIFTFILTTCLSACASDSARRTTFETVQNLGAMQCTPELGDHCSARLDYQGYQENRKRLNNGEAITPDQTDNCDLCARQHRGTSPSY